MSHPQHVTDSHILGEQSTCANVDATIQFLGSPVYILWKIKITLRKKILLSAVFGMVGFTIAVPIVRGSLSGGVYKPLNAKGKHEVNMTWIIFWFYVELTVCKSRSFT